MVNKSNFFSTILVGASLFAQEVSANHQGFFVGVGVGRTSYDLSARVIRPNAGNQSTIDHPNLNKSIFQGNFFGGYAHLYQRLYLAGVVNVMFVEPKISGYNTRTPAAGLLPNTYWVKFKSFSYGGAFRIGYASEKWVGYFRLGAERRQFQMYFSDNAVGRAPFEASASKWAIVPGIGTEYKITDHVAVGAEYRMSIYSNIQKQATLNGGLLYRFRVKPQIDTISFSVKYTF